ALRTGWPHLLYSATIAERSVLPKSKLHPLELPEQISDAKHSRRCSCGLLRSLVDGRPNPGIGAAAAEIAGHDGIDVLVGRILIVLEHCNGLHDLPRLAVPALRDLDFHPCFLHRMHR